MAKSKDEKEVRRSRGNSNVMKSLKNLSKPLVLWGQFFHRIPCSMGPARPIKSSES